jgi:hypothetical protein
MSADPNFYQKIDIEAKFATRFNDLLTGKKNVIHNLMKGVDVKLKVHLIQQVEGIIL